MLFTASSVMWAALGTFIVPADAHRFTAAQARPLIDWINEREAIRLRKQVLSKDPGGVGFNMSDVELAAWGDLGNEWTTERLTDDPILQQYKFCNVGREHDRVTVWIRQNIREPYANHEHLWFMISIARFINWPPTLEMLIKESAWSNTWPDSPDFHPAYMTEALEAWKAAGNKVETGAYMIRAESRPEREWYSWSKQRYVSEVVLGIPWRDKDMVAAFLHGRRQRTLQETWMYLSGQGMDDDWVGWGPFMAGQVVADLRHTRYLRDAPDVGRWAPVGPGSARGLNRLAGRPLNATVRQEQGLEEMLQLQGLVNERTGKHVPPIELHDLQNCLCETDKYLRVKHGEGRPRALYKPETAF